jgi:hypothetical protein
VLQYFFMLPSYVNILMIYSYCNTHDLSWGTKGLEAASGHGAALSTARQEEESLDEKVAREAQARAKAFREVRAKKKKAEDFKVFRSQMLIAWIMSNALFVWVCLQYVSGDCYLTYLAFVVAGYNSVRIIGCGLYIFLRIPHLRYGGRVPGSDYMDMGSENVYGGAACGGVQSRSGYKPLLEPSADYVGWSGRPQPSTSNTAGLVDLEARFQSQPQSAQQAQTVAQVAARFAALKASDH